MLYGGDPLGPPEQAVLDQCAAVLARLLALPGRATLEGVQPGRETDRLVRRLFEDNQAQAYNQFSVAVPGVVEGTARAVVVVAADGETPRQLRPSEFNALVGALTPTLRHRRGYLGATVTMSYALIALHQPDGTGRPAALLDEIDRVVARCLASDSGFTLGISDTAPLGLRSARDARNQALAAAELAALDPALGRRAHWAGLGAYRLLGGRGRGSEQTLAALDAAGSSAAMLIETLEVFLDLAGDVQRVASRLNLHRSSLYYRLSRISQLLEVDLADGMVRLELHMALKQRRSRRRMLR